MSVTVSNNSPSQDYVHPDDQTQPTGTFINVSIEKKLEIVVEGTVFMKSVLQQRLMAPSAFSLFLGDLNREFPFFFRKKNNVGHPGLHNLRALGFLHFL